ncbi:MAG: AAA family ATPase [Chthoniobacterales bacterium]
MPPPLECIILIGLPGSGKTTLYKERFGKTHSHISKDLWPNASGRETRQQKMIERKLAAGESIVIDNTNPTARERARIIETARRYQARIAGFFFDVSTRAAVARNAARTGRSKVPNVAIFTTAKRLQRPTKAEGFDELFRVEISEDRSLRITKLSA